MSMKYSVLKMPQEELEREQKSKKRISVIAAVLVLIVNIILTILSGDSTLKLFAILNALIDIAAGVWIYTYYILHIGPQNKLLRIYKSQREIVSGTVTSLGSEVRTHMSVECTEAVVGERSLLLPVDTIELTEGEDITVKCAFGVIVEVEK